MIAVIADDFTGAAELAGISLRYGLKASVCLNSETDVDADVLVVSTDSRSMSKDAAMKVTAEAMKNIMQLKPDLIYKKIDSVFRGYALDELKVQMQQSGIKKAFVLGANPSLGRTISEGRYFINGDPISETDFGTDPEFAITDSSVLRMIKARPGEAIVLKHTDELPGEGIVIAEVESEKDVTNWANKVDSSWLLAGAGDFFTALLHKDHKAKSRQAGVARSPHLYVSGTAFGRSQEYVKKVMHRSNCVAYLPALMMKTGNSNNEVYYNSVKEILNKHDKAIVAINDEDVDPWNTSAVHLRTTMAEVVRNILERIEIKELFIEGGSTAASVLKELKVEKLSVVDELRRGVVRMKAKDIYITVKPGSYELPDEIKQLYNV